MVTVESVFITAAVVFTLVLILNIVLLWDLGKSSNQISSKKIRITSILCLLTSAILALLFVVYNIIKYISLTSLNTNPYKMKSLSNIVLFIRVIAGVLNFIFVAYFITIKLEDAFKDTFLSIKKHIIYICFIIYIITMCINWWGMFYLVFVFSHWYPTLKEEPFQTLLAITNGTYSLISEIYFILILIMFNWKLFKFVRLTMTNNEVLSLEINNRFKNFVIKQTNLISIITIAFCIFQAIAYWKWVQAPKDNVVNLLYPILFTIQQSLWTICIYLTFKFNNKYYYICCKYSHLCCIYSCTNLIKGSNQSNDNLSNKTMLTMYTNYDRNNDSNEQTSTELQLINVICLIDHCPSFKMIFDRLTTYNQNTNEPQLHKYEMTDILNAFNHLLIKHDSERDFAIIYEKLRDKMGSKICQYTGCQIYSRHYSRRQRDSKNMRLCEQEKEEKKREEIYEDEMHYSLRDFLDKLHSFYYHSYDTFARIKVTEHSFRNEDDRICSIHKMVKSRGDRGDRSELLVNKFNSDLKLKDNNIKNDIYSFGERFEYEDEKNEWLVKPKYSSMKCEFIENETCSISMEIYQIEYNKCQQYMNTNVCKQRKFSLHRILALMIYCNCDRYQAKWSETFRQIPYNESTQSLKKRHSHFFYVSKNLRDLIEYFGSRLIETENENKTFYHGVNQILYLTRTITKFNAPLSTSTEATIALNFSGDIGVVLELKYSSSTYLLHAKFFDCAFFSDFINEKECLFLGGIPMMIITNIINVSNGKMYRKYINALNIINCILNGTLETDNKYNYHFNQEAVELCHSLISYQLNKSDEDHDHKNDDDNDDADIIFPQYIVNLLNRYCINLNNVMIFWYHMDKVEKLKGLLCNHVNDKMFFDLNQIMALFPNLQQIEYRFTKNNELKSTIKQIMHHIGELSHNDNASLKYVIIHHKITMPQYENNGWKSFQDHKRIILYKKKYQINFSELNFKYNQIKQSNASKNMIKNLL